MKQWAETRAVLAAVADLVRRGHRGALATVVSVRGSAYRHEGAKLLVREDGSTVGNVSGGCLERDVIEVAHRVIASQQPELRAWCGGPDEIAAWDLGVGCDGTVELLIEPVRDDRAPERRLLHEEVPHCVVTHVGPHGLARVVVSPDSVEGATGDAPLDARLVAQCRARLGAGGGELLRDAATTVFVEYLAPPPQLLIISAADDAREVARLAHGVGFGVTVVDKRPGWLEADRFPDGVRLVEARPDALAALTRPLAPADTAVVMTHDFADDAAAVDALLRSEVGYIGVLGPRSRSMRLLRAIGRAEAAPDPRLHAPVGLDIGTDGAEQVALAIVAELLAVRSGRAPRSLRERAVPIHGDTAPRLA